jgi:hypothetical protein
VLWVRFGFLTDPDTAFFLNADQDSKGSETNEDPNPGQTLPLLKVEFFMKNIFSKLKIWLMSKF